ncbi:MAG: hypothetical protein GEU75_03760 [Dehalococcoidia bacterium]|nr:hypothetical protein [Dehalococcoidia bacterium]
MAMGIGSSCWNVSGSGFCADKSGIITPDQPLTVTRGANITIEHPSPGSAIEATVTAWPATAQPAQVGNELAWRPDANGMDLNSMAGSNGVSFSADLDPGRYFVSAFFVVPEGDVSYGALIEVK